MGKITLSVCKVYRNTGRFRFHRKKTKPSWKHYFITDEELEDDWTFGTEWVNAITAQFLKLKKWHLRLFYCEECWRPFKGYVKNDRMEINCPYCPDDED